MMMSMQVMTKRTYGIFVYVLKYITRIILDSKGNHCFEKVDTVSCGHLALISVKEVLVNDMPYYSLQCWHASAMKQGIYIIPSERKTPKCYRKTSRFIQGEEGGQEVSNIPCIYRICIHAQEPTSKFSGLYTCKSQECCLGEGCAVSNARL